MHREDVFLDSCRASKLLSHAGILCSVGPELAQLVVELAAVQQLVADMPPFVVRWLAAVVAASEVAGQLAEEPEHTLAAAVVAAVERIRSVVPPVAVLRILDAQPAAEEHTAAAVEARTRRLVEAPDTASVAVAVVLALEVRGMELVQELQDVVVRLVPLLVLLLRHRRRNRRHHLRP